MNRITPVALTVMALAASACAIQPEARVVVEKVMVPTPVTCVPASLAGPPGYVDNDDALRAARDAAARFLLVVAGRDQRRHRLDELEPVIAACRAVPAASAPD